MAALAGDSIRIRVAAVVILDDKMVLVRHRFGEHSYHLLPGGGVEAGETLQDAVVREVREETGLTVELGFLLFVNDTIDPKGLRHILNVTFTTRVVGGELTDRPRDPRIEAVDVVEPEELPLMDLRPPIAGQLLEAYRQGFSGEPKYLGSLWVEEPV